MVSLSNHERGPVASHFLDKTAVFLATGCGVGFIPWAPGTWGTFAAAALFGFLLRGLSNGAYVGLVAGLFAASIWISQRAALAMGRIDPKEVVIDEFVGFYVTMFFLPSDWMTIAAGVLFFRIFDITKVFPARPLDKKLPGGWGIVVDDVVAGVYANLSVRLILAIT
ncbi:MAG: phosphatidylglycerophosphatase A [Nitrospirae bacterium]|nr:phosphatidylglycerophosphatase A [Nitrospirota bacterium]